MNQIFSYIISAAMVFGFGYLSGCDAERDEHAQAEKALQHRVEVLNDLLKKRTKEIEDRTNANVTTIRNTTDVSGCASAYAPTAILDSVR